MRSRSCRAFALAALLVTGAAWADPPAPLPDPVPVTKGQPAPGDGVWLATAKAIDTAARCSGAEQENAALKASLSAETALPKGKALVIAGVVVFALGLLVGGFAVAVAKK